jgi:hypothetical protein
MRHTRAALTAALALGLFTAARGDEQKAAPHHHRGPEMEKCLKACVDCAGQCESCFVHCTNLVASGKKEHVTTLRTCLDCGDVCVLAAKVISRDGALAGAICEGCAKACDGCGDACEKHPGDEHMKACAKACRDCSKACREMVKSTARAGGTAD